MWKEFVPTSMAAISEGETAMARKYTVHAPFHVQPYFTCMQRYLIVFMLFVVGIIVAFNFVLGFFRRMTNSKDRTKP